MWTAIYGIILILVMGLSAACNTSEKETEPRKHLVAHTLGWIFSGLGCVCLIINLISIFNANTKIEVKVIDSFSIILFALAAYCFNFKKSNTSFARKILKFLYYFFLIGAFAGTCNGTHSSMIIFLILWLGGLKRIEYSRQKRPLGMFFLSKKSKQ